MVLAGHGQPASAPLIELERRMHIPAPSSECPATRRSGLMAAAQAGDRTAYATLLRECVPLIEQTACRQGVAPDRLDEVVQDVLLTIHRARHTYDPKRSFDGWLHAIARSRALDGRGRLGSSSPRI